MAYTCRLYLNSGFNSINIPDSPTLLNSLNYIDVPALQILQSRDLRYVDIKVSGYEAIKNADYCRVDDWFYFVEGISMLNVDTARVSIIADYLTSAGGPAALHVLDGITTRVHAASDTYGEWTEVDPYMAPARPLLLDATRQGAGPNKITVVKTTLDLAAMGAAGRTNYTGITYTDQTTGETVTVPQTELNADETDYELHQESPLTNLPLGSEAHTKLFNVQGAAVRNGIQEANNLGINGSITAQVEMPLGYVTPHYDPNVPNAITQMVGSNIEQTVALPFEYDNTVKNKKILYSEHTPYGIVTASGAKCEYAPFQIYEAGETQPHIRIVGDPRTDGKPYFRFLKLYGNADLENFFNSAVEGVPWKQVPLVYEGAQGNALAQLSFNQSERKRSFEYDLATQKVDNPAGLAAGLYSKLMSWGSDSARAFQGGNVFSKIPGVGGLVSGIESAKAGMFATATDYIRDFAYQHTDAYNDANATRKYLLDRELEKQQLLVDTNVYSPTVQFPFSADLFRDLYNNDCIVYRYRYSSFDLARIDKILTMYGYKITKNLTATDFTNRTKFNYVEAGVSVGKLPRWWADGIAAQISAGVRVWHVLPDNTHYTNNPIAT